MCPVCLGVAAWATVAGSGSAGGLATILVARRRIKRDTRAGRMPGNAVSNSIQSMQNAGGCHAQADRRHEDFR